MYTNVIVIGCDKTGKTTLINELMRTSVIQEQGFVYFKGDKQSTPEEALAAAFRQIRHSKVTKEKTLYDRFHFPDDIVYHPVTAGGSLDLEILAEYFENVYEYLVEKGTLFIYCHAPIEVIATRFVQEKEELIEIGAIHQLLKNYDSILAYIRQRSDVLYLDSGVLTPGEMLSAALTTIERGSLK